MTVPNEASDENILAMLDKMKADTGAVPGRNAIMREAGIGAGRATRLRQHWSVARGVTLPEVKGIGGSSEPPVLLGTYRAPDRVTATNGNGAGPDQLVDQTVPFARIGPADQAEPGPHNGHAAGSQLGETLTGLGLVRSDRSETEAAAESGPVRVEDGAADRRSPAGAPGFYVVAAMSLLVSADTSWRFFGEILGITNMFERVAMFGIVEAALIACGYAMRAGVRGPDHKPGPARLVLWALCGLSGYMALDLSGVGPGLARIAGGPVLGVVMLHLALGIEIRHTRQRTTTWAKIGSEYRERFLSRLGLADDARDAAERTRLRAARRAARLAKATPWLTPFRRARLRRALRLADVAHQERMQDVMLAELRMLEHADALAELQQASPWKRA